MQQWIWATIGLAVGVLVVLYLLRRKPMSFDAVAPRNRATMLAAGEPTDVLEAVAAMANKKSIYALGPRDDATLTIVLQEGFSLFNYGSLFQIAVKPDAPGKSILHIAVVGKRYQWGPAFQRSKRKFIAALQKAVGGKLVNA